MAFSRPDYEIMTSPVKREALDVMLYTLKLKSDGDLRPPKLLGDVAKFR